MTDPATGYAVFLFDQAVEVLGEAIKPYLQEGAAGPHIPCHAVDTGGAFVEMTVQARTAGDEEAEIELMVPIQMVRMIVSMRSDEAFGFAVRSEDMRATRLPPVGPAAPPAREPSAAVPATSARGGAGPVATADDRRRPPEG